MSNSGIITKIEFKYQESDSYTQIGFIPESAKLYQTAQKEAGGWVYTTKVPFKIAKNEASTVEPIVTLLRRKAIYKLTDGNGTTYTIGNDEIKASLGLTIGVGGSAGSFNGREVEIACTSDTMLVIA